MVIYEYGKKYHIEIGSKRIPRLELCEHAPLYYLQHLQPLRWHLRGVPSLLFLRTFIKCDVMQYDMTRKISVLTR